MGTPNKMEKLAQEYGEPAVDVVLKALNEHITVPAAARVLNLSETNLFRWVVNNGIEKKITWVKKPRAK